MSIKLMFAALELVYAKDQTKLISLLARNGYVVHRESISVQKEFMLKLVTKIAGEQTGVSIQNFCFWLERFPYITKDLTNQIRQKILQTPQSLQVVSNPLTPMTSTEKQHQDIVNKTMQLQTALYQNNEYVRDLKLKNMELQRIIQKMNQEKYQYGQQQRRDQIECDKKLARIVLTQVHRKISELKAFNQELQIKLVTKQDEEYQTLLKNDAQKEKLQYYQTQIHQLSLLIAEQKKTCQLCVQQNQVNMQKIEKLNQSNKINIQRYDEQNKHLNNSNADKTIIEKLRKQNLELVLHSNNQQQQIDQLQAENEKLKRKYERDLSQQKESQSYVKQLQQQFKEQNLQLEAMKIANNRQNELISHNEYLKNKLEFKSEQIFEQQNEIFEKAIQTTFLQQQIHQLRKKICENSQIRILINQLVGSTVEVEKSLELDEEDKLLNEITSTDDI